MTRGRETRRNARPLSLEKRIAIRLRLWRDAARVPMKKKRKSQSAKRRLGKGDLKLPEVRVPEWLVERWRRRVERIVRFLRRAHGVSAEALAHWGRLSRRAWEKLEAGKGKWGPTLMTVMRAFYALNLRDYGLVITCEGPRLVRLRAIG